MLRLVIWLELNNCQLIVVCSLTRTATPRIYIYMYINEYLHFMQPGENTLSHTHTHKTTDNLAVTAIIKISPQSKNSQTKNIYVYIGICRIYILVYVHNQKRGPSVSRRCASFKCKFWRAVLPFCFAFSSFSHSASSLAFAIAFCFSGSWMKTLKLKKKLKYTLWPAFRLSVCVCMCGWMRPVLVRIIQGDSLIEICF